MDKLDTLFVERIREDLEKNPEYKMFTERDNYINEEAIQYVLFMIDQYVKKGGSPNPNKIQKIFGMTKKKTEEIVKFRKMWLEAKKTKLPENGTKEYALADALSRSNAVNGTYEKLGLPLDWASLNNKDATHITHLVNLADEKIQEAKESGKDLNSRKVQKEIQSAVFGGSAGATLAITYHKLLDFLGFRKRQ